MAEDLVSVVTRTKDRPEFLRDAAASVAAQTYPNVEHVIVNDGGVDVADVLEPFRGKTPITYLTPGAVGRCRAGNLALAAARGRWIAWLDDDDLFYPDHLASLVRCAKESGAKVVYSQADRIAQSKDPRTGRYVDASIAPAPSFEWSKISLWLRCDLHLVTVLYAREVHERLGGFDETLEVLEDFDLFARFAQDYEFKRCAKTTAAFRVRDDLTNAVTSLRKEFVATRELLMARYAHIMLPELLGMIEHGHGALTALTARVGELEAEVRRLGAERPT
jgi:O-antigen biosynthesis protein